MCNNKSHLSIPVPQNLPWPPFLQTIHAVVKRFPDHRCQRRRRPKKMRDKKTNARLCERWERTNLRSCKASSYVTMPLMRSTVLSSYTHVNNGFAEATKMLKTVCSRLREYAIDATLYRTCIFGHLFTLFARTCTWNRLSTGRSGT